MCVQGAVTVLFCDSVHVSRICSTNGIPFRVLLGGDTPSIVYTVHDNNERPTRRAVGGTRT